MTRWKILRILRIQTRDGDFIYENSIYVLKYNFVATYKYVSGRSFSTIMVDD